MSGHSPEAVQKQVKLYWKIFLALMAGTAITVGVAKLHMAIVLAIVVAIIVATVKGGLVAGYFMHLFSERGLIYFILALTAAFVVVMISLLMFSESDHQGHGHGLFHVPQRFVQPHDPAAHTEDAHVP